MKHSNVITIGKRSASRGRTMFAINIDGVEYRGAYPNIEDAAAGAIRTHRHRVEAETYEKSERRAVLDDMAVVIRRVPQES